MKIGRAIAQGGGIISWASMDEGGFRICDPYTCRLGEKIEIERFLAPVQPTKIIAVGLNYRDHVIEMGHELPKEPVLFMKPSTAVIGPFEEIRYPSQSTRVDYEAELGVVMGKTCKGVKASQARDYIMGYTCFNDVTARDLQARDGQWTRAKSFDTFAPMGPWIVTDIEDPHALAITAKLGGEIKQSSNTSNLIFNVFELVEFISGIMTLNPGDTIATGTPSGVGPMNPGDEIVIEIQGIGVLSNKVAP